MISRLWVYKNNSRKLHHQWSWGSWAKFFEEAGSEPYRWGDSADVGPANRRDIFEMSTGDLILCWQSDRRVAVGTATVAEMADYFDEAGIPQRSIILRPLEVFPAPVPILDLRKTRADLGSVAAFRQGNIRTIYATTPHEAELLLTACGATKMSANVAAARRANALSEAAAVKHVTSVYTADRWQVSSREAEKIGYDLDAKRGRQELHLEVKGAIGPEKQFFLTANEYARASEDRGFLLCLVTSATSPKDRALHRWTGAELISQGTFRPASFRVSMSS